MEEISYSGSNPPSKKRISKRVALFGIFFIIILLLLGSVAYFVTSGSEPSEEDSTSITLTEDPTDEVVEEEAPTEEPEATEAPTPSKAPTKAPTKAPVEDEDAPASSGSVAVQNGSGESGVAGSAADVIKAAGFSIASTGNADNFDYTDVTIQVKNSKKSILADLEKALSAKYTIGDTSTDLPEATSSDALVIIGK